MNPLVIALKVCRARALKTEGYRGVGGGRAFGHPPHEAPISPCEPQSIGEAQVAALGVAQEPREFPSPRLRTHHGLGRC